MKLSSESVKLKFLALLFMCCLTGQAHAEQLPNVKSLKLSYSVYVGGIHAMNGVIGFTKAAGTYNINLTTGTQGFLRRLAPWDAEVSSRGRFAKAAVLRPSIGNVMTKWDNKPYHVGFAYNRNKIKALFNPPEGDGNNEHVPEEMKQGALDPLSGVLQVISNTTYNSECNQNVPIYDGHRRFDLSLSNSGHEDLDGEGYSVFTGTAQRCIVDFKMLAGSRKDREGSHFWQDGTDNNANQGNVNGRFCNSSRPPVYIFLGKVRDDLPEIPVRAETSTVFGGIVVHLTRVEGGGGKTLTIPD